MFRKVGHIGIAVFSLEEALKFYRDVLGLNVASIEPVESEGVRVAVLPVGETQIELLEPLDEKSPLHKRLKKHGEGVHHVALAADSLNQVLAKLKKSGLETLGEIRSGAGGARISFVHPKSAHGVLIELCQDANSPSPDSSQGS